jgi:hypothetical protein
MLTLVGALGLLGVSQDLSAQCGCGMRARCCGCAYPGYGCGRMGMCNQGCPEAGCDCNQQCPQPGDVANAAKAQ